MAQSLYGKVDSVSYSNLFADMTMPVHTKSVKLKAGQGVLVQGTVLGIETETGLAVKVDSTKADGTESADSILTDTIDTGSADPVVMTAYASGTFNRKALVFGSTDTADKHEATLRKNGIYLKDNLAY